MKKGEQRFIIKIFFLKISKKWYIYIHIILLFYLYIILKHFYIFKYFLVFKMYLKHLN